MHHLRTQLQKQMHRPLQNSQLQKILVKNRRGDMSAGCMRFFKRILSVVVIVFAAEVLFADGGFINFSHESSLDEYTYLSQLNMTSEKNQEFHWMLSHRLSVP